MVKNNADNCRKWRSNQGELYKRKENLRVKNLYVPMALRPSEEQEKLRERARKSMAKTRAKRKAARTQVNK